MPTIILACIILGPIILLNLLRVNAVYVYLSLCLGYVLSQFVGDNSKVSSVVASSSKLIKQHFTFTSTNDIKIGLLLLPVVLTIVFMLRSAKDKRISLNLVPSLAVGLLAVYLVIPLLPPSTTNSIIASSNWTKLVQYQTAIIGISSAAVMLLLFLQRSRLGSIGNHHKHHKE